MDPVPWKNVTRQISQLKSNFYQRDISADALLRKTNCNGMESRHSIIPVELDIWVSISRWTSLQQAVIQNFMHSFPYFQRKKQWECMLWKLIGTSGSPSSFCPPGNTLSAVLNCLMRFKDTVIMVASWWPRQLWLSKLIEKGSSSNT